MSNRQDKPKMSAADLVKKMRDEKGITFNLVSEAEAERYLSDINNYLRTASYRKNYQKYQRGTHQGKYINLDFAYLQELSSIDLQFRHAVTSMCLDIEHDLKIHLLKEIDADPNEDGYSIVKLFLLQNPYILDKLAATSGSAYTGELMHKYLSVSRNPNQSRRRNALTITAYDDCPVWVFLEFVTFGDFIRFYEFYYDSVNRPRLSTPVINAVRSLRNGCAHNNCMLADIERGSSRAPAEISQLVAGINTISATQRRKKLSSRLLMEIVCMLYAYQYATRDNDGHRSLEAFILLLTTRMLQNKEHFQGNPLFSSSYDFICKIVVSMYGDEYNRLTTTPKKTRNGFLYSLGRFFMKISGVDA